MRLLLGVTGGIAAYKACEIVSLAMKAGHEVRILMTESATQFVGPATFEGLSGQPPMVGNDHLGHGQAMNHIHWARWAEVACVAPLTANTMAKMASGFADDAVTTTLLALGSTIPLVLAPAMNTEMWNHPAVQENLHKIMGWGHIHVVQPIEKRLACGEFGAGALADPQDILHACETRFQIPEQPATVGLR